MLTSDGALARTGVDGLALKPAECDLERAVGLGVDTLTVDFEGHEHVPDGATLRRLADGAATVRLTMPVRADGYDPLGDDSRWAVPDGVARVVVAGHPAYLSPDEADRAVAPRIAAARDRDRDAWVGTESIERLALAAGGTQFELLSRSTRGDLGALRAAGVDAEVAVYAPLVCSDDEDTILDAVGDYVARRGPVADALPDGAGTDASAAGRAREVLSAAVRDYALVGTPRTVRDRVEGLRAAGASRIVAYPARGLETVVG